MGKPSDLVQGGLELLILKNISLDPKRGWAITKRIQLEKETANWSRLSKAINIVVAGA
jgi:hypothetical protein